MEIAVIDSIAEVSAADFERLDATAGAVGSYQRISQREADGRWRARYLRCLDGDRLAALIPLYTAHGSSWPDPVYDPAGWPLPAADTEDCDGRQLPAGRQQHRPADRAAAGRRPARARIAAQSWS